MGRGHHGECGIQESHKYVLARGWGWGEGRKKGQMGDCQVVLSFQAIGFPPAFSFFILDLQKSSTGSREGLQAIFSLYPLALFTQVISFS